MLKVSLKSREVRIIVAALRDLRGSVDALHVLEPPSGTSKAHSCSASRSTSEASQGLPTVEELDGLESKLSGVSESEGDVAMWTVVVLRGGLLDSLYVTENESVHRRRFDATCRFLRLPPDDPCNEDYEVYHDTLVRKQQEYCWE